MAYNVRQLYYRHILKLIEFLENEFSRGV